MSRTDSLLDISPKHSANRGTLRVLIADDEHLSRERLKRFLRREPGTELVAECASGSEALQAIRHHVPDAAFLDVRMPELDAFGILEALRNQPLPAIILVTAFDHFALRAFDFDAVDYLLKPFDRHRFQATMRRVRRRLQLDAGRTLQSQEPISVTRSQPSLKPLDRITVRSSGRITLINTSDIDWISAADNYVELHIGPKIHLLRLAIGSLANRLAPNFARISRSILVNQHRIREVHSKSHGDFFVVLVNGVSLPGSRNYRDGLSGIIRG